jgi:spore maturation protein CgeB
MSARALTAEPVLSILYLGRYVGTSRDRANSLRRLGHNVRVLDPESSLPYKRLWEYWNHHMGAACLGPLIRARVLSNLGLEEFDVVWVDGGALVSPQLVRDLKRRARFVINYNLDDPYGTRDANKWNLYLRSVPLYDLIVVVRDCNVAEAFSMGARDVLRIHRSADEVAHAPRQMSGSERSQWKSEVAFVGTWMPERGPFFARLIERGVPVSIWGYRWDKAEEIKILRPHWRGPAIYDDDYAFAIQCAKVCIGILSRGNRDLCTQRTFEIPHLGGLLCAERTREHQSLYEEDVEAVFWSDADECAERCDQLLKDDNRRERIAREGQLRSFRNATTNEAVLKEVLARATMRLQPELNKTA